MGHHNSVFHDVSKRVPWAAFEHLACEHEADKHVRRLSTKGQPREFGVKVSIATTNRRRKGGQFVLHGAAPPGNPRACPRA